MNIVQVFLEKDEKYLRYTESTVAKLSGGQKQLSPEEHKLLCRLYAVYLVEEAWRGK